jgi:hypothetical protein
MLRHRSILARLLFSTIACVLVCAVSASEIPEHLNLTNDTSNDYIVRALTTLKIVQALGTVKLSLVPFVSAVPPHTRGQSVGGRNYGASLMECDLFILLSVLRT